jgi:threonine/homoserine/homoserine lactone efflux protein
MGAMPIDLLLAFFGATVLLFLKPGPAMSVIVANSAGYGVRGGLITVAGNVAGFALLLTLVALGLAWIAQVLQHGFDWVRIGGAIYLVYLGATRLWSAGRVAQYSGDPTGELLRDGFLVAVANLEVILFLAAFLPPFVDPSRAVAPQLALLSATFIVVSAIAGGTLAYLAGQARSFLSGERLKWIDVASGGLLILAGLWLGWPKG